MFCKHCGAKTDVRKARCPVCGADQRTRRFSFFSLVAVALACALFAGILVLNGVLQRNGGAAALTAPAAYTAPAETTTEATGSDAVFITHAGTKYHLDGCAYLNDTKEKIALSEAIRQGYEPCAACFPEAQPEE
jgi:hypothetical protein